MATLGSLVASLELQSAAFTRGLDQASNAMRSQTAQMRAHAQQLERGFRGVQRAASNLRSAVMSLAGILAVRQFATMAKSALDTAGALGELATAAGVTVRQLQELRFAAISAGISNSQLETSLQQFSRRIGEAAQGSGALLSTLERYDIAVRNASGATRSTVEILGDLADAVQNAESAQERLRIANQAFGRSGAVMVNVLMGGREQLVEFARQAHAAGVVLSDDLVDKADAASDSLGILSHVLKTTFQAAIVTSFASSVSASASAIQQAATAGRTFGEIVGKSMAAVAKAAVVLANNIDAVLASIAAFAAYKAAGLFLSLSAAILTAAKSMTALNLAMRANPIGLVATAVAAAVAALVLFRNHTFDIGGVTVRRIDVARLAWLSLRAPIAAVGSEVMNLGRIIGAVLSLDLTATREAFAEIGQGAGDEFGRVRTEWERLKAGIEEPPDLLALQRGIHDVVTGINEVDGAPFVDLGDDAATAASGIDRLSEAQQREAAARAAYLRDLELLQARRIETVDGINREVHELTRMAEAQRQGEEAVRSLAVAIEIEQVLRESGLALYSAEGQQIARLIRQRAELEDSIAGTVRAREDEAAAAAEVERSRTELMMAPLRTSNEGIDASHANAFEAIFS